MPGRQLEPSGDDLPESVVGIARCGDEEFDVAGNICPVEAALLAAGALGASAPEG